MQKEKFIDISSHNAGIDYNALKKSGYSGAVIKAGQLFSLSHERINFKNSAWDSHLNDCIKYGLKIGSYVFGMAKNINEAEEEAFECLKVLSGVKLDYPVFYDAETRSSNGKTLNAEIFKTFAKIINDAGCECGIYINPFWIENHIDTSDIIGKYPLWIAAWNDNPDKISKYIQKYNADFWQWGLIEPDNNGNYITGDCSKPRAKSLDANIYFKNNNTVIPSPEKDEPLSAVAARTDYFYNLREKPYPSSRKIAEIPDGCDVVVVKDIKVKAGNFTYVPTIFEEFVGWSVIKV